MRIIGLLFVLMVNFAFADISANCKTESGVITCSANESGSSFADVSCEQKENQTICKGSYQDLAPVGLGLSCDHLKNGNIECSGGTDVGYKFSMSCKKQSKDTKNMDCDISDNLGSSLSLSCKSNTDGIPNCFGKDNEGKDVSVNCLDDGSENASCSANIK
ncbi:MAG: hypothetical protein PHC75_08960 [Burkholderiales bacterium]|nr:hypothetical protein [Burkholderiales bacterium]